jgi:hypothetical protein
MSIKVFALAAALALAASTSPLAHRADAEPSFVAAPQVDSPASPSPGAGQLMSFRTLDIGRESGCSTPAKMLITDETEWQRVWKLHNDGAEMKLSAPVVDFAHEVVVALLMGDRPGTSWISAVQIVKGHDDVTVYYEADGGQRGAASRSRPYHFLVMARPNLPVRFADANLECSTCVVRG